MDVIDFIFLDFDFLFQLVTATKEAHSVKFVIRNQDSANVDRTLLEESVTGTFLICFFNNMSFDGWFFGSTCWTPYICYAPYLLILTLIFNDLLKDIMSEESLVRIKHKLSYYNGF